MIDGHHYDYRPYRVSIRKGGKFATIKPGCEVLDGMVHRFRYGWTAEDDEEPHGGEILMEAHREGWPEYGPNGEELPICIAAGDLEPVNETP